MTLGEFSCVAVFFFLKYIYAMPTYILFELKNNGQQILWFQI